MGRFLKWREHMNTSASTPRIAVIQRSSNEWSLHPLFDKTKRRIAELLEKGKSPEEIIKSNEGIKGFSKANVYKCLKQLNKKEEKKDAVNKQDTNGNAEDVF